MDRADEFTEPFSQAIQEFRAADSSPQMAVDDKVHGIQVGQLDPLNVVPVLPILAHELPELVTRHEGAEPPPLLRRVDEQSQIHIPAFVTGPSQHKIPQRSPYGRSEGFSDGRNIAGPVRLSRPDGSYHFRRTHDEALSLVRHRLAGKNVDGLFDLRL